MWLQLYMCGQRKENYYILQSGKSLSTKTVTGTKQMGIIEFSCILNADVNWENKNVCQFSTGIYYVLYGISCLVSRNYVAGSVHHNIWKHNSSFTALYYKCFLSGWISTCPISTCTRTAHSNCDSNFFNTAGILCVWWLMVQIIRSRPISL